MKKPKFTPHPKFGEAILKNPGDVIIDDFTVLSKVEKHALKYLHKIHTKLMLVLNTPGTLRDLRVYNTLGDAEGLLVACITEIESYTGKGRHPQ
jgi:hypothetical protein